MKALLAKGSRVLAAISVVCAGFVPSAYASVALDDGLVFAAKLYGSSAQQIQYGEGYESLAGNVTAFGLEASYSGMALFSSTYVDVPLTTDGAFHFSPWDGSGATVSFWSDQSAGDFLLDVFAPFNYSSLSGIPYGVGSYHEYYGGATVKGFRALGYGASEWALNAMTAFSGAVNYVVQYERVDASLRAKVFVDGVLLSTSSYTSGPETMSGFYIGRGVYNNGTYQTSYHQGRLSCFRLYNGRKADDGGFLSEIAAEGPSCSESAPPVTLPPLDVGGECPVVTFASYSGSVEGEDYLFEDAWTGSTATDLRSAPLSFRGVSPGLSDWRFTLAGFESFTGTLSDAVNAYGYFSGVTVADSVWYNPLTWRNDKPKFEGRFLEAKPNVLLLVLEGDDVEAASLADKIQFDAQFYVKTSSGSFIPPLTGPKTEYGSDFVTDWAEDLPLRVAVTETAGQLQVRFDSALPVASFRFRFPGSSHYSFRFYAAPVEWGTETVATCSASQYPGPYQGDWWDSVVGPSVPGADNASGGSWLAKIGWTFDVLGDFAFSVPDTPQSPQIVVPFIFPRSGTGAGLDIGYVTTGVKDLDTVTPLFRAKTYDFGTGGFQGGVSGVEVSRNANVAKILSLFIAAFYVVLRIGILVVSLSLLILLAVGVYFVTETAFPIVSERFGRIQVSAGFSGLGGIASVAAMLALAGVLVPAFLYLATASLPLTDFMVDRVAPILDFVVFALVRNLGADWAVFAGVVNVFGNTLFVAATAFAVWRLVQFLAKS